MSTGTGPGVGPGPVGTNPGSDQPPATESDGQPTTAGPPPSHNGSGGGPTAGSTPTDPGSTSTGTSEPTSGGAATPEPSATPTAAGPGPTPTPGTSSSPPTGGAIAPYGVAGSGRVPADGSQPRLDRAAGAAGAAHPAAPDDVNAIAAAGWTSMLPAPEVGVKIFVAGLVALVIAIGGLVTVALRRRDPA